MEATIIKKDGKATLDKPFEFMLSLLRNGEYTLTIKRKTKPRTLNECPHVAMVPMYRGLFQGIHRRGILEHR